jgi:hypothetical protein
LIVGTFALNASGIFSSDFKAAGIGGMPAQAGGENLAVVHIVFPLSCRQLVQLSSAIRHLVVFRFVLMACFLSVELGKLSKI